MQISPQILEQLLYEDESSTLDFKRDQYPFEGAGKDDKSELLKDILAFINAWRRSDAYILIGVDEVRGGRSIVVGITKHLDDANLQQFVNSKTQRPVHFSYQQATIDNKSVGILYIPPQDRPVYLSKGYGKLDKEVVYIRRNSSTDIAAPDEIARMGRAIVESLEGFPILELQFYDSKELTALGTLKEIETVNLSLPKDLEIPDYGVIRMPFGPNLYHTMPSMDKNREYYRDTALYLKKTFEVSRIEFMVNNFGNVPAKDVRLELFVTDPTHNLIFRDANDMPDEPSPNFPFMQFPQPMLNLDVNVQQTSNGHHIIAKFGKIQPKASGQTCSGLFIGACHAQTIELKARIFSDNLPAPQETILTLEIQPGEGSLSVERLIDIVEGKDSDKVIGSDEE